MKRGINMGYASGPLTFPAICNEELESLIKKHATELVYSAKSVISTPGDSLDYIYYVKNGRTRHVIINYDGNEKVLYCLSRGWFFGEASSDLELQTSLYSIAEENTIIYKITAKKYRELVDNNKLFRDAILRSYAQKILILRYELEDISFNSCKNRLKRLLFAVADTSQLIDDQWYNLKVKYTQYDLGIIVGGARVTINKLINELCTENSLRIINHKMQINKIDHQKCLELSQKMSDLQCKKNSLY